MSPAAPPSAPLPPWPRSRTLLPVSAPAGTVISSFLRLRTSPTPLHVGHRCDGTRPRPRQTGHVRVTANPPWPSDTTPRPLHSGHVLNVAPGAPPFPWQVGHCSVTSSSIGTFPPRAAVRNGTSSVVSTDCPRSGPAARPACAPFPNMELNRSPRPPSPPTSKSSKRKFPPVCPPAPGPGEGPGRAPRRAPAAPGRPAANGEPPPNPLKAPRRRISSYCLRFSGSPSTVYASETSLKRSAALGSLAFASG